ncbi:MAG: TRAP transporter small permease [Candidatus Marinimicrobia bacterium]|jgi:TRAP-type C4-dicarboxylate transport system permease small subunit|nr:TRAP transporter small permease [Candidatus Neomarinimicrobiota bacterium]MBT3630087.1 TRAP transporter small permease [Candidatus Neomarinimicrobiota bacterium]MBT3824254.1 TRAP transporter small permease [Candidatus Neomarinimicrobiota bacterium]MBT4131706.1 TRAP transporter small permease [Candidatus Neomarinimicrobiota bacterium]MBT4295464.1 TRAP transporter small permease [Candidatus Neomarinimicrobiota bacterium]
MKWLILMERRLKQLLEVLLILCFSGILALVLLLVVLRYGFNTTLIGGNEFVVILFVYASALGAAVVLGKNEHISITWFVNRLPLEYRKYADIINFALVGFINGVMLVYSIGWIATTGDYVSAALGIPQYFAQMAVPLGCGVALLYSLNQILLTLFSDKTYDPSL